MQNNSFQNYLQYEKRFSTHTVQAYLSDVKAFGEYMQNQYDISDPSEVKHSQIRSWMVHLLEGGMTTRSVNRKLSSLRGYFRFLRKMGKLDSNPFTRITGPRMGKRLPTVVQGNRMDNLLDDVVFPDGFAGTGQSIDIVDVEIVEYGRDFLVEAGRIQELPVCRRCRRKAARDGDAEAAQVADHLAERGVLAAYEFDVPHAKLVELDDVWIQDLLPCVRRQDMENPTNG